MVYVDVETATFDTQSPVFVYETRPTDLEWSASASGQPMREQPSLESALLDLGLEDLIALPEIHGADEVQAALPVGGTVTDVVEALVTLLRKRQIQVWSGHWSRDPQIVLDQTMAEELLREVQRYTFKSPEDLSARVYYVNVENRCVTEH